MGEGIGLAIKVEDGASRAKRAVALPSRQLDGLTPTALEELEEQFMIPMAGQRLEVIGDWFDWLPTVAVVT